MQTLALILIAAQAAPPAARELPPAIDFDAVSRVLSAEPKYVGAPRYGMFLFEPQGEQKGPQRMWLVLDKSTPEARVYDVLYVDRDGDAILGEEGERYAGALKGEGLAFEVGDLRQPGTEIVHTDFVLTWTKESVRFRMKWRGETVTMGGYGPYRETYAPFGEKPSEATIYVPGYDRPLEFEHWMCDKLRAGGTTDFKVFVGARGSRRGAFSCGDEQLLPKGEHVLATLVYTSEEGKEQRVRAELHERC